jgi:UDP-2,4-diacetamido-2,4,6-trideoxy-beta-L-altropyranose hydrolase
MIIVRPAALSDADDIFQWRNEPASRMASQNSAVVGWDQHLTWFTGVLANTDRSLYICSLAEPVGASVGMCRFDVEGESAEVSINLNPAFRGRGLAQPILERSIDRFTHDREHVHTLTATIRPSNTASVRIFTEAGFRLTAERESFGYYVR